MSRWHLLPGFPNPVFDSQYIFRKVLEAVAHPGRLISIEMEMEVPEPLYRTTGAICLTLLDHETSLWMDLDKQSGVADWLRFHCGCPFVHSPSSATFGLIDCGFGEPPYNQFHEGEDEFPEHAATLILQVAGFRTESGRSLRGPGIETIQRLEVQGLSETFWRFWRMNHRKYPLGVDVLFTSRSSIVGLPRTIEVVE